MDKLELIKKVSQEFVINRYDNGWAVSFSGRDSDDEWVEIKHICLTQEEILELFNQFNRYEVM